MTMTFKTLLAAAFAVAAVTADAAPAVYDLDPGHSQIVFSYNHLGYSTTYGMFSGFEGSISFDATAPGESSVNVSMPVRSMLTGWEGRFRHFMGAAFFDAADDELVTFISTGIEVTGANTGRITGDLTLNGVTRPVVLDAKLNQANKHPMSGKPSLGFNATAMLLRSDFDLGRFAPQVGDEVEVIISIEAVLSDQ